MIEPYTDKETEYIKYLISKYCFRIGTKEDNYRLYRGKK